MTDETQDVKERQAAERHAQLVAMVEQARDAGLRTAQVEPDEFSEAAHRYGFVDGVTYCLALVRCFAPHEERQLRNEPRQERDGNLDILRREVKMLHGDLAAALAERDAAVSRARAAEAHREQGQAYARELEAATQRGLDALRGDLADAWAARDAAQERCREAEALALSEKPKSGPTWVPEICICAAVSLGKGDDDVTFGYRHADAMRTAGERWQAKHGGEPPTSVQGFVTSRGRFVDRREAMQLQKAAGIRSADPNGYRGDMLFSEDLY